MSRQVARCRWLIVASCTRQQIATHHTRERRAHQTGMRGDHRLHTRTCRGVGEVPPKTLVSLRSAGADASQAEPPSNRKDLAENSATHKAVPLRHTCSAAPPPSNGCREDATIELSQKVSHRMERLPHNHPAREAACHVHKQGIVPRDGHAADGTGHAFLISSTALAIPS